MSLEEDYVQNLKKTQEIEKLLENVDPVQRGAIYTMLLIYTAHALGVSKQELLQMIEHFFDSLVDEQDEWWN